MADSESARLLRGTLTVHHRPHVDELAALQSTFTPGEHQRPSLLSGGGHLAHASFGHEQEEKLAHFAREIYAWLQKELELHQITELDLYAPARFLGTLRKVLPKVLTQKLREHESEITKLSPAQLAEHPPIAEQLRAISA